MSVCGYPELRDSFRWQVPESFNIGVAAADAPAERWPAREALIDLSASEGRRVTTFGELARLSNRFANVLAAAGIGRGERVAVLLSQGLATGLAHLAVYKLGAVALPLFTLFGERALEHRLADSGARAVVTDRAGVERLEPLRERLPELDILVSSDGPAPGALDLRAEMERASDIFRAADTAADDPALLLYTSGTTGSPKGALHAHRVLLGHLPGVSFPHDFFPQPGDRFWTPADWAWIGGLFDVLLPAWFHGVPVIASRARKFEPEAALELMAREGVRNVFLPPTALKLLRQVPSERVRASGLRLRSCASGGESLGEELLGWGREALGLTINEFYGQTECNLVIGNSAACAEVRPGAMGLAIPGHEVGIVDEEGRPLPDGREGDIAIAAPDPVMFLGYWRNPEATAEKFRGRWLVTGDRGLRDPDGYFHFVGRADDVITSAGYRIGPGEIENALIEHPAVALAAAIGKPDPLRTEIVKAFVVLAPGSGPSDELARALQEHVRTRLAAHAYPREVAFVEELPMTTTGKIRRGELRAREIAASADRGA